MSDILDYTLPLFGYTNEEFNLFNIMLSPEITNIDNNFDLDEYLTKNETSQTKYLKICYQLLLKFYPNNYKNNDMWKGLLNAMCHYNDENEFKWDLEMKIHENESMIIIPKTELKSNESCFIQFMNLIIRSLSNKLCKELIKMINILYNDFIIKNKQSTDATNEYQHLLRLIRCYNIVLANQTYINNENELDRDTEPVNIVIDITKNEKIKLNVYDEINKLTEYILNNEILNNDFKIKYKIDEEGDSESSKCIVEYLNKEENKNVNSEFIKHLNELIEYFNKYGFNNEDENEDGDIDDLNIEQLIELHKQLDNICKL